MHLALLAAEAAGQVSLTTFIIGLIGSGGLTGAIMAFYKVKPERDQVIVESAKGALVVTTGVIDRLNNEIGRLQKDNDQLEMDLKDCHGEKHQMQKVIDTISERRFTRRDDDVPPDPEPTH